MAIGFALCLYVLPYGLGWFADVFILATAAALFIATKAALDQRNHKKSIGVDLHVHPYADLSLTMGHTLRGSAALQSA
jgi:hypothetical protein